VLLGSAPWLIERGLTESLAGRFEVLHLGHWSYPEMRRAFGWNLERYIYFGGYPGAAPLVQDEERWARYILDSLIETTIARDVLLLTRVDKPALLRRLFELSCRYSGQILSYNKMLGQLHDAGNTTTLAHYLDLLEHAGMVRGLPKYAGEVVRRRASSPKLQVFNTALMSAQAGLTFDDARKDRAYWGRLVESAVGAYLANAAAAGTIDLHYWRHRNDEIDFVVTSGPRLVGIEVKSAGDGGSARGRDRFREAFDPDRVLVVGPTGIPLEHFLSERLEAWVG
jgi:hypothetical protein